MPFKSEFCKYEGAKTGDQTKLRAADLQDAVRENPDYLGPGWPRQVLDDVYILVDSTHRVGFRAAA